MRTRLPLPKNRIRELREERGWSQAKLGAQCVPPMHKTQIDKREKGETSVTIEDLHRLARALEVHPADLLPLPPITPKERAVLELYRGLAEPEQQTIYRVLDAMPKSDNENDHTSHGKG